MSGSRQRRRAEKRRRQIRSRGQTGSSSSPPVPEFELADRVELLVYTRRQAAEALGISIATLDRRIVPALNTVKTPWGARMIPIGELERFLDEHTEVAAVEFSARRRPGRRPSVPRKIVDRIQREHAEGRSLGDIARKLNADGIPTSHEGRRWWPSTVRSILARSQQ